VKRVSPQDAKDLMDTEGYVYVDVRSIPEFDSGHPEGAYNVPINHMGPAGMTANAEFVAVMEKAFGKDAKIIVACRGGGRSLRAAGVLEQAGFTNVVDQRAGFEGHAEPGWRPAGLPVATDAPADRTYEGLKTR
jgi:rhodanese-related sulfurtransferase